MAEGMIDESLILTRVIHDRYHGPNKYLAFDPKLTPQQFKGPYTSAESWGSYEQTRQGSAQESKLSIAYGNLQLKTFAVGKAEGVSVQKGVLKAIVNGNSVAVSKVEEIDGKVSVYFLEELRMKKGDTLIISWS